MRPTEPARPPAPDAAPAAHAVPDPPDDATLRLRALLRSPDPWSSRLRRGVAAARDLRWSMVAGAAALVAAAIGAALVVGRGPSVDPVAVLPRVGAASAAATAAPAPSASPAGASPAAEPAPPGTVAARIVVHAAGAVALAGVFELPDGARVDDVIAAAGGLAADADLDRVNLAAPVRDGERVYVPRRGEAAPPAVVAGSPGPSGSGAGPSTGPGTGGAAGTDGSGAPLDLNAADAAALEALPGIGPATAAAIVRHRTEHGPFRSVDELEEVPGIGPAKLAQLRELVRV